ncbi:hypothetical protein [Sphingosinithalassobacter sp. LHW66-3]|uniref:hypothetical protein n=1 Tax=Sphingosinithalassobacter sp. LHW66-3 TaxID=3424718 RepID=UPI003D6BBDC0
MKTFATIAAAATFALLSACGNEQDAAGDVAEQQMQSAEDVLEEKADLADERGNEMQEERLDAAADAVGDASGDVEETIAE